MKRKIHLPLLHFKLSQHSPYLSRFPLSETFHPLAILETGSLPLPLFLSLSFVCAPKAPLNLAHRTNGLLYASVYIRTIPFYRDSSYLSRRYLLSDRLTSSSLFNVNTYTHATTHTSGTTLLRRTMWLVRLSRNRAWENDRSAGAKRRERQIERTNPITK